MDKKTVKALQTQLISGFKIECEDGEEASNASRALEQVRCLFKDGSVFEKILTDALIICDEIADRAEPGDEETDEDER